MAALKEAVHHEVSAQVVYEAFERVVLTAPYIPGYLAFREVGFIVQLLRDLQHRAPDKALSCHMVSYRVTLRHAAPSHNVTHQSHTHTGPWLDAKLRSGLSPGIKS